MSTIPYDVRVPDLPIPNAIRAMAILSGTSGLPEDRYVNTFWFREPGGTFTRDGVAENVTDRISDFYSGFLVGQESLTFYMSDKAIDQAAGLEVRVYFMDDETPREPTTLQRALDGFEATVPLPAEVALVGSFYGTRNIPRRRGRVYVGPLNLNALSTVPLVGDAGPSDGLVRDLRSAMQGLAQDTSVEWCVASRKDGALYTVTNGWVDNAFDTQRRRGGAPTSRSPWTRTTI